MIAQTLTITFSDWMRAMRNLAVEEFGYSREAAEAIREADVQALYLHGCTPEEALAALSFD
jgi:hypothetical protein